MLKNSQYRNYNYRNYIDFPAVLVDWGRTVVAACMYLLPYFQPIYLIHFINNTHILPIQMIVKLICESLYACLISVKVLKMHFFFCSLQFHVSEQNFHNCEQNLSQETQVYKVMNKSISSGHL